MKRLLVVVAAALLALGACANGDDGASRSTAATQQTSTTLGPITNGAPDELPALIEPVGGVGVNGFANGGMLINRNTMPAGTDLTPFLPDGSCEVPHWGYVIEGAIHVRYADDTEDSYEAGTMYYMRPGHTVWVDVETRWIEVSPDEEMQAVLDHGAGVLDEMLATTTTAP